MFRNPMHTIPLSLGPNDHSVFIHLYVDSLTYIPPNYFSRLSAMQFARLEYCGLTTVPVINNLSLMAIRMAGNPIESVPDLSKVPNMMHVDIDTDAFSCDWRNCWLLFEAFNMTGRTRYTPYVGPTLRITNDLANIPCESPAVHRGRHMMDVKPLEMECYNSRFIMLI